MYIVLILFTLWVKGPASFFVKWIFCLLSKIFFSGQGKSFRHWMILEPLSKMIWIYVWDLFFSYRPLSSSMSLCQLLLQCYAVLVIVALLSVCDQDVWKIWQFSLPWLFERWWPLEISCSNFRMHFFLFVWKHHWSFDSDWIKSPCLKG